MSRLESWNESWNGSKWRAASSSTSIQLWLLKIVTRHISCIKRFLCIAMVSKMHSNLHTPRNLLLSPQYNWTRNEGSTHPCNAQLFPNASHVLIQSYSPCIMFIFDWGERQILTMPFLNLENIEWAKPRK